MKVKEVSREISDFCKWTEKRAFFQIEEKAVEHTMQSVFKMEKELGLNLKEIKDDNERYSKYYTLVRDVMCSSFLYSIMMSDLYHKIYDKAKIAYERTQKGESINDIQISDQIIDYGGVKADLFLAENEIIDGVAYKCQYGNNDFEKTYIEVFFDSLAINNFSLNQIYDNIARFCALS